VGFEDLRLKIPSREKLRKSGEIREISRIFQVDWAGFLEIPERK
jgi:hypothetical protein